MRRGIFDTLRRGAESTLANWPLIAIRFAEMLLFGLIAILAVVAMLVPILVSIGIRIAEIKTAQEIESAAAVLLEKWPLFLWFGAGMTLLLMIFVLVHAYVEAGCARVLVDADRTAGPAVTGPWQRYRAFSMERWAAGAKEGGWRVFWIYNLAWTLAAILLLIPLIPIFILILVFQDNPAAAAGIGCLGLLVFLLFAIVVAVVTGIWTNRAIADWAVRRSGAREALAGAWRAVKLDLGRHVVVTLAVIVVAMAGSSILSSVSMFGRMGGSFGRGASLTLVALPLQLAGTVLSSAFSAVIANWYLASYAALAVESKP